MREYIKDYLIGLGCAYAVCSVGGAIVNIIAGTQTNNANVLVMFAFCAISIFVLSLHKFLTRFSPLFMIIIQYFAALGICALLVFIISRFSPVSARSWFELFRSFTIPYIIGAAYYYYRVYKDARKQDALIKEIQQADPENSAL